MLALMRIATLIALTTFLAAIARAADAPKKAAGLKFLCPSRQTFSI